MAPPVVTQKHSKTKDGPTKSELSAYSRTKIESTVLSNKSQREMEALEEMMRKQRELEDAQKKWAEIQKARYLAEGEDSD